MYINQPDIVYTFFGLNNRFNLLVTESVRHFTIPIDTEADWFAESMSHIQNAIEMIILQVESVPRVFSCTHSYPSLRSVILKSNYQFIAKLNVEHCSALGAIISCLNLLRIYSVWVAENGYEQTIPLFEAERIDEHSVDWKVCDLGTG